MISTVEAVGIVLILIVVWSVYKADRTLGNNVNLLDLIMARGKLDRVSCVFMGSWGALTFVFVATHFAGKMTEGLFTAYAAACFAPICIKMFAPAPLAGSTESTSITQTTQTVTPIDPPAKVPDEPESKPATRNLPKTRR